MRTFKLLKDFPGMNKGATIYSNDKGPIELNLYGNTVTLSVDFMLKHTERFKEIVEKTLPIPLPYWLWVERRLIEMRDQMDLHKDHYPAEWDKEVQILELILIYHSNYDKK